MKKSILNLGIVGCGGIAGAHGEAAKALGHELRFVAACDIRRESAEAWAGKFGAERVYTDYVEMIRKEALDGILLATWPNLHREQVARAVAAGARNILCEKALAMTGKEALQIYGIVHKADAFLMEGFMYRHNPLIRRMERLLAIGDLGAVDNVRACFSAFDPETANAKDSNRNWRQRKECGGGIPYDFACYCVNACGHFANSLPTRVYATGGIGNYGTINRFHGMIEYENGVVGIIESSKKTSFTQELQISCAHGILNIPIAWTIPGPEQVITQRHTEWNSTTYDRYTVNTTDNQYGLQLRNFAAVIRGDEKPVLPLEQSVVNMFTLEALVKSVLEKRQVEVKIPKALRVA